MGFRTNGTIIDEGGGVREHRKIIQADGPM